jgi:hypothetical protein
MPNNIDEEGDSTQADISLDDSNSVPLKGQALDNQDPTDYSDTTEDDVSEGKILVLLVVKFFVEGQGHVMKF